MGYAVAIASAIKAKAERILKGEAKPEEIEASATSDNMVEYSFRSVFDAQGRLTQKERFSKGVLERRVTYEYACVEGQNAVIKRVYDRDGNNKGGIVAFYSPSGERRIVRLDENNEGVSIIGRNGYIVRKKPSWFSAHQRTYHAHRTSACVLRPLPHSRTTVNASGKIHRVYS